MEIIEKAGREGRTTLSEFESKQVLARYGIPVVPEMLVAGRDELNEALEATGFPVVLKGCSPEITHKTEKALIELDIRNREEAFAAYDRITAEPDSGGAGVLVQEMVKGARELMVGLTRDPQFGPCVMFGLGGIFTEILKDVSFRLAPLDQRDAIEMMSEIRGHKILDGIRGMEPVDPDRMASILVSMGRIGLENDLVKEVDVNPLIIREGNPVAVDALIVLDPVGAG
jgi:acetyl-CoA synthetase (ADP-forming)